MKAQGPFFLFPGRKGKRIIHVSGRKPRRAHPAPATPAAPLPMQGFAQGPQQTRLVRDDGGQVLRLGGGRSHLFGLPHKVYIWTRPVPVFLRGGPSCRRAAARGLFFALGHRVAGLIPGLDAAGTAVDVCIAQLHRPHGAVVAPGAFDEAAVEHQGLILVGS
jgi:hypothetical protein